MGLKIRNVARNGKRNVSEPFFPLNYGDLAVSRLPVPSATN
jgi:hypothetical protein